MKILPLQWRTGSYDLQNIKKKKKKEKKWNHAGTSLKQA